MYDAWDNSEETVVTEEEPNEAEDDSQPSFRPYQSKLWGRLPGLGNSKQAMLRIAKNVQTWCFESNSRIDWRSCKGEWGSDDVPLFLPARKIQLKNQSHCLSLFNAEVRNLAPI